MASYRSKRAPKYGSATEELQGVLLGAVQHPLRKTPNITGERQLDNTGESKGPDSARDARLHGISIGRMKLWNA
jgi:hypothetical protein